MDYAVSEKLFNGTSATTFAPNAAMTRGMFVTVLGNKAGLDTKEYPSSSFSDVNAGTWYAPYVEWAAENEIISGIGGGKFAPDKSVTREQMAVILYNYAKFTDCDLTTRAGLLEQFPDGDRVSGYAKYALEWAVTHKIISGSGGRLDPRGTATRAQVAQIFYSSRELLDNPGGEEPQPPTPSPSPDVTPSPSPSPDPDAPRIPITDEVRAKLKPNQDPEKILDYVLNGKNDDPTFSYDGTTAKWDPTLVDSNDVGKLYLGSYTGLTTGKTYKLFGVLMDKSSGEPLLVDGQKVTAEKEFTPENASGTEEMTFTFDASTLAGKAVVVFETLTHDSKEVAAHTDINDEGQTVEFEGPEIKTKATVNGEKEVDPLETIRRS